MPVSLVCGRPSAERVRQVSARGAQGGRMNAPARSALEAKLAQSLTVVMDVAAGIESLLPATPARRDPMFDPRPGDVLQDGEEAVHAIVAVTADNVWFYAETMGRKPGLFCWPRAEWIATVTDTDPEATPWTVFACAEECAQQERGRAKFLSELDAKPERGA